MAGQAVGLATGDRWGAHLAAQGHHQVVVAEGVAVAQGHGALGQVEVFDPVLA